MFRGLLKIVTRPPVASHRPLVHITFYYNHPDKHHEQQVKQNF